MALRAFLTRYHDCLAGQQATFYLVLNQATHVQALVLILVGWHQQGMTNELARYIKFVVERFLKRKKC